MSTLDESIAALCAAGGRLSPADQEKARSLVRQYRQRGFLSERQTSFVELLVARANNGGVSPRVRTAVGDLGAINALFARAATRLKAPSVIMGDGTGAAYRLRLAGANARVPGSINVISLVLGTWYGRILSNGEFEASPRDATPAGLIPALQAFAADPAKAAGAHAKATGRCMFCSLPIGEGADPRARAVGYGEVCAQNFGLPFPSAKDARALNSAVLTGNSAQNHAATKPLAATLAAKGWTYAGKGAFTVPSAPAPARADPNAPAGEQGELFP